MFTKVTKEIILAAKGGGDPDMNARLRAAIDAAKAVNLPKDKIETAIKKGTGELASEALEEITYEGYAPGGVAILIEAVTDNRNRTVAEVRHILSKGGGSMGAAGCVAWMFDHKGVFAFDKVKYTEDQLLEVGLEAGVEDVLDDDDSWQVQCAVEDFHTARSAFEAAGHRDHECRAEQDSAEHGGRGRGDGAQGPEAVRRPGRQRRRAERLRQLRAASRNSWRRCKPGSMAADRIILGVDPGSRCMGYGLVRERSGVLSLVDAGTLSGRQKRP